MKVNKVQQDGPILFVAKDKPGQFLIRKRAPEDTWKYRQASFHHAHMIHVRYFDNLICGWTGAWVLFLLEQASHLWLTSIASIRNYNKSIKVNHLTVAWNIWIQISPLRSNA